MFLIKEVEIQGFWGSYNINSKFFDDVNIFIGDNGTGKTTFINILLAVLKVDIRLLANIDFESVKIILREKAKTKTIFVQKLINPDLPHDQILFKLSRDSYKIPLFSSADEHRRFMRITKYRHDLEILKSELDTLINISSLSVNRLSANFYYDEEPLRRTKIMENPIDTRLNNLMRHLTRYQLNLAEKENKVSDDFQKEVLSSILFHAQFDKFDIRDLEPSEFEDEKKEFKNVYKRLKILDKKLSKKIDNHFGALSKSIIGIKDKEKNKNGFFIDDIMPLPLLSRTQHIINLSLKSEKLKEEIFESLELFKSILQSFITDKKIEFSEDGTLIFKKNGNDIRYNDLSSGEKQLLILLIETLLQNNRFFIFIADEPELSLHINWQAKIIKSIKKLNPQTQVILATHSPEIAGGFNEKLINMEDIFYD